MLAPGMSTEEANDALTRLIGADALARLDAPLGEAAGLPNAAFTSEAFFALEQARLFARSWLLAGFAHQIPDAGDIVPVEVAGAPVILVRTTDGGVRGFHNVCRHRGARLVSEPCAARRDIVCPYHAWTYDLDGRLVARPYFGGKEAAEQDLPASPGIALAPVRTACWLDMIFVDLSGRAAPLEDHLAPVTARLDGYDLSTLGHAGSLAFDVAANWKFACENFIETYHVFSAHPALARFAPMKQRSAGGHEAACFFNEYRFVAPEAGRGADLPHYPGLADDKRDRGAWFLLFPTLGIEIWPDQFTLFRVIPEAPEHTREEIHVYLMGEAATAPAYADARAEVLEMWRALNAEDIGLLENLQAGRRSPGYHGGLYSPAWEEPVRHFARLVVRSILEEPGP